MSEFITAKGTEYMDNIREELLKSGYATDCEDAEILSNFDNEFSKGHKEYSVMEVLDKLGYVQKLCTRAAQLRSQRDKQIVNQLLAYIEEKFRLLNSEIGIARLEGVDYVKYMGAGAFQLVKITTVRI